MLKARRQSDSMLRVNAHVSVFMERTASDGILRGAEGVLHAIVATERGGRVIDDQTGVDIEHGVPLLRGCLRQPASQRYLHRFCYSIVNHLNWNIHGGFAGYKNDATPAGGFHARQVIS